MHKAATAFSPATPVASSRLRIQAIALLVICPLFNLCLVIVLLALYPIAASPDLLVIGLRSWTFAALILTFLVIAERTPLRRLLSGELWIAIPAHLLLFIGAALVTSAIFFYPYSSGGGAIVTAKLTAFALEIVIYVLLMKMLDQRENAHALQVQLHKAQLTALRSQTNPHFLYNTLNLIGVEVLQNPPLAHELLHDLANLLRRTFALSMYQFVSLREEIAATELYCGIQQQRFSDRFDYHIDCSTNCLALAVPALLLQPLVENTIRHAVAKRTQSTRLTLVFSKKGDSLEIELCDNGPGFSPSAQRTGSGLRLVHQSLQLGYPTRHRFTLTPSPHGTHIKIEIPAQLLPPAQKPIQNT